MSLVASVTGIWKEVLQISAWTGLSVGALAAAAALAYFVPQARALALIAIVIIVTTYSALIYGAHTGASDVRARWNAANVQAEKDRKFRDTAISAQLTAKYDRVLDLLNKDNTELQDKIDVYEKQLLAANKKGSNSSCALGPAALRLRVKRR